MIEQTHILFESRVFVVSAPELDSMPGFVRLPAFQAADLVERLFHTGNRATVARLERALGLRRIHEHRWVTREQAKTLARIFGPHHSRATLWREKNCYPPPPIRSEPLVPDNGGDTPVEKPTWIALTFTNRQNATFPNAKLKIRLPDGQHETILLDPESSWRHDELGIYGTCHVELLAAGTPSEIKTSTQTDNTLAIAEAGPSVALVPGRHYILILQRPLFSFSL